MTAYLTLRCGCSFDAEGGSVARCARHAQHHSEEVERDLVREAVSRDRVIAGAARAVVGVVRVAKQMVGL